MNIKKKTFFLPPFSTTYLIPKTDGPTNDRTGIGIYTMAKKGFCLNQKKKNTNVAVLLDTENFKIHVQNVSGVGVCMYVFFI